MEESLEPEIERTLDSIIRKNKEADESLKVAARSMKNQDLKVLFMSLADQCAKFAGDLQRELGREDSSGPEGVREDDEELGAYDEASVVSACEAIEGKVQKSYEEALKKNLPFDVRSALERQYMEVKTAHEFLQDIERAIKDYEHDSF